MKISGGCNAQTQARGQTIRRANIARFFYPNQHKINSNYKQLKMLICASCPPSNNAPSFWFHFRSISHKVSLIKGDGIGPEIAASVKKIFEAAKVCISSIKIGTD